jgi:hypothetical protein
MGIQKRRLEHWWCESCETFDGPISNGVCNVCIDYVVPAALGSRFDGASELVRLRKENARLREALAAAVEQAVGYVRWCEARGEDIAYDEFLAYLGDGS